MTLRCFHVSCRHINVCARTRKSVKYPDKSDFLASTQNRLDNSFKHADAHGGLGRAWNCSDCALGYDSMLSKHIQMLTPGILALLHLNGPSLRVCVPISLGLVRIVKIKWRYHTQWVWKIQKITLPQYKKLLFSVPAPRVILAVEQCRQTCDSGGCLLWNDEAKANIKPIYECRCNGRLQTKRSTWLSHTGLVVELEDLKIKTRLTNEKFVSVKGECEI